MGQVSVECLAISVVECEIDQQAKGYTRLRGHGGANYADISQWFLPPVSRQSIISNNEFHPNTFVHDLGLDAFALSLNLYSWFLCCSYPFPKVSKYLQKLFWWYKTWSSNWPSAKYVISIGSLNFSLILPASEFISLSHDSPNSACTAFF